VFLSEKCFNFSGTRFKAAATASNVFSLDPAQHMYLCPVHESGKIREKFPGAAYVRYHHEDR
jgi:hypothetical protein